jgi:hypothetical protein
VVALLVSKVVKFVREGRNMVMSICLRDLCLDRGKITLPLCWVQGRIRQGVVISCVGGVVSTIYHCICY